MLQGACYELCWWHCVLPLTCLSLAVALVMFRLPGTFHSLIRLSGLM